MSMISEKTLQTVIECFVKEISPGKIFLFGSYARGEAKETSDLDFLIIKDKIKNRRKETVRLYDSIRSLRVPVDILMVSQSTFNEWIDVPNTVIYKAVSEGKLCYAAS